MHLFTLTEIEEAFQSLMHGKLKNKRKSYAFESIGFDFNGKNLDLLPVGMDGVTTMHILKNEQSKKYFLNEIFRLTNECYPNTNIPRIELKKYKIKEIIVNDTKKRIIVIPCLRDQVVIRCILNKLNQIGITDEENKPNPKIDALTKKIRNSIVNGGPKKIIRTDISNFYPSIHTPKLLELLEKSHGDRIDPRMMHLIRKVLLDNKSKEKYEGLPVGVGFCVLLANFYISQMRLSSYFPEIEIVRYEDDVLFITDQNMDAQKVLSRLDQIYQHFGIKRNELKTEIFDALSDFKFIGVNYSNGFVSIGDEKFNKWKIKVADDIKKQFRDYTLLKIYNPEVEVPSNRELVNKIWKAHKKGIRSKVYQHAQRIKKINEEPLVE